MSSLPPSAGRPSYSNRYGGGGGGGAGFDGFFFAADLALDGFDDADAAAAPAAAAAAAALFLFPVFFPLAEDASPALPLPPRTGVVTLAGDIGLDDGSALKTSGAFLDNRGGAGWRGCANQRFDAKKQTTQAHQRIEHDTWYWWGTRSPCWGAASTY